MMNEIQVFNNPEFGDIRTIMIENEPWWIGKDIAEALAYKNTRDALVRHVDEEDRGVAKHDTLGGAQDLTIINESGLYSLVLSSKLPSAKKFKRWITSEVLPALRKTGRYGAAERRMSDREESVRAAELISSCAPERLVYVLSILRQAGFEVPETDTPKPVICGPIGPEDMDRLRYNVLLTYPQLIPDYPEVAEKFPDLTDLVPKSTPTQEQKQSNRPEQLRRGNPRDGYTKWFNLRKLKRMLKDKGWSQSELSKRSGLDKRSLRRYLTGTSRPGTANRNVLCDAFGIKHGSFDK